MSEQPTSWRERFFGSTPSEEPAAEDTAPVTGEQAAEAPRVRYDSAELAPDSAEVAATSVDEHDEHQPLVDHEGDDVDTAVLDTQRVDDTGELTRTDASIEPTVIAPSSLRGPSHSASHPDDTERAAADDLHGEAAESSMEQPAETDAVAGEEPPALVEPRRPSFGLRRRADDADDAGQGSADDDVATGAAAVGTAGAAAATPDRREWVEPEPTQALETQATGGHSADDDATQAIDAQQQDDQAATRVLETQPGVDEHPERFGIIRDEVPASSIPVDDETARAAANGGTPIVLVEEPMPPRRKGARGVGFLVVLLATVIFAALFAAAFFAVGYLFDREFNAADTLQEVWLRPSYLLPVIVFFVAYWIVTLIVNRAGWWAHVLGAFIVALLAYAAHIGGAFMEQQGGWAAYTAIPGIDPAALGQLLLAPLSVIAFIVAREVPVWVGGIMARRGRNAREWNRKALEEFNAENDERLAAYERARG